VVKDFDGSVNRLAIFLGIPLATREIDITHPYRLRLDVLLHRARLIVLEENVRMATSLEKGSKVSQHSAIMCELIQRTTALEAKERLMELRHVIVECGVKNLSRLEAEARLVQLCFHIVLRSVGAVSLLEVDDSFRRILNLCQSYPDTAGQLFISCTAIREVVGGTRYKANMYTEGARHVWWRLPNHRVGNLAHCCNGHPYSSLAGSGCPECGRKVPKVPKTKTVDPNTLLKENDFKAAMKVNSNTINGSSWRKTMEVNHRKRT